MGKHNKPPAGSRRRVQMRLNAGTALGSAQPVAGFIFSDASQVPDQMLQYSSATYSLSSPVVSGVPQFAVTVFSLSSPNIPDGLKRIAILPET